MEDQAQLWFVMHLVHRMVDISLKWKREKRCHINVHWDMRMSKLSELLALSDETICCKVHGLIRRRNMRSD